MIMGNKVILGGVLSGKKNLVAYSSQDTGAEGVLIGFTLCAKHMGKGSRASSTYVACTAFGDLARKIDSLAINSEINAVGYLKNSKWNDKATGAVRYSLGVIVNEVNTPGTATEGSPSSTQTKENSEESEF